MRWQREILRISMMSGIWAGMFLLLYLCVGYCFPYEEQSHLFLYNRSYIQSALAMPGGLVFMLTEFLTQFYYYPWSGALVMSGVYILLTGAVAGIGRAGIAGRCNFAAVLPMALLPEVLCGAVCRFSLTVPIGVLCCLGAIYLFTKLPENRWREGMAAVSLPILYYLAGTPGIYVYALLLPFTAVSRDGEGTGLRKGSILLWISAVAVTGLLPRMASGMVQYPLKSLYAGINDFTFSDNVATGYYVSLAAFALLPYIIAIAGRRGHTAVWIAVGGVATLVSAFLLIPRSFSIATNDIVEYDYLARHNRWDAILEKARKRGSGHPIAMMTVNLALANKGLLDYELLNYPQRSYMGLLEDTGRNGVASFPSIMAYLQLGLPEVAFRGAFEYQESLPSYRKSGRCMELLATAAAREGNPGLARKYGDICRGTLFYRDIKPEGKALAVSDDMFYLADMADRLEELTRRDPSNVTARQYLVAWLLLTGDIERFETMMPYIATFYKGRPIPRAVQEAAAYIALKNGTELKTLPIPLDEEVERGLGEFISTVNSGIPPEALRQRYPGSYWTYLITNQ